ncbi:MAG: HIT domain-containing protein [Candidatus Eisenbacteria bacterium]
MDRLWAPWRMEYLMSESPGGCIFCDKPADGDDRKNLILFRSDSSFVLMNAYPYNNGHVMVAPLRHAATLSALEPAERCDLIETVARAERMLESAFSPQGMNMGVNLGHCAGAGVPGHVHVHIVPRWEGDTNFMPVLGETRVIPELLVQTYERLLGHVRED